MTSLRGCRRRRVLFAPGSHELRVVVVLAEDRGEHGVEERKLVLARNQDGAAGPVEAGAGRRRHQPQCLGEPDGAFG
ncbi:hypothetical protein [Arthrobacter sp. Marseille-P9274]|uniref:hypothetical protein n=1 Tax=Arthrobacter sp. Marseille-P9274 TaxID=2866572 RepID=UPI0021C6BA76|nr:hypothetical protein [Arthrobacter sp. Marseille-P9274]